MNFTQKNYLSIPGFQLKKQKFRPKKHKGPKIGGGIAVFVKQNIAKNVQLIPNNNIDSIWIKTTFSSQNHHIGFYYCSPENAESNFHNIVNSEIEKYSNGQNTLLFGDFNARTKTVCDKIIAKISWSINRSEFAALLSFPSGCHQRRSSATTVKCSNT